MAAALEADVTALARRLAALGTGERSSVYRMSWWNERLLDWAMSRPDFKTQLFRFVDVFPALDGAGDVARHLDEYFHGGDAPRILNRGLDVAEAVPFGRAIEAGTARRSILRMARQFIAGASPDDAAEGLAALWRSGSAFTCDLLGEKTVTVAEADAYAERIRDLIDTLAGATARWAPDDRLERDDLGPLPRVNVSIKPTALSPHYGPLAREIGLAEAKQRIRPLLRLARARGAFVHFDAEDHAVKDLTVELFCDLLAEDEFADLEAGIVVQAYLRDARTDLADVIRFSAGRPRPITVRLVKGAYWDTETVHAQAHGWPVPVFEHKAETDASYEHCIRQLHDAHGQVRAAFGTHNLRSLAYAIGYARSQDIPDDGYEIQMLYGMAEPAHAAVKRLGMRLRVYTPVGALLPGMAYLVRRLLENTSNESFVRNRFAEGHELGPLIAAPAADGLPEPAPAAARGHTDPQAPRPYEPEPVREWHRADMRAAFGRAVAAAAARPPIEVPALIDGQQVRTTEQLTSVDPGCHDRRVATSACCGPGEADAAVAAALAVAQQWRHTPVTDRAGVAFRAAAWLRERRDELSALEVFEAGKPWDQADADVCEAIDFCEYYGREILRLSAESASRVQSPPGERNRLTYQGKGVAAVISPWNFPLAIPCGMTVASLVAGNPVILKPAEQTPVIAWQLVQALLAAGAPEGTVQFLPGPGETVGARLVAHHDVALVTFTGSREVGLGIYETAARTLPGQRHIKRVVAELGGKNVLIVDDDADPDVAVPAVIASAFSYAGQKCSAGSRVIVLDRVYDAIVARLVAAAREVVVGHASDPATTVGPVIDGDAHARLTAAVERAGRQARVLLARDDVPDGGWYIGPTVVEVDEPVTAEVAREELFGPVLAVLRARDLAHALALANDTEYGLTAGICSRSPARIARAAQLLRAGNVYVNRNITGSVVGRQPFGGLGLSGVGSKAGGPDYLLQLTDPRVVTENTVRQGFAPTDQ
ncbi:MAG: aldehyde dehydrogenase family protein [Pseudonocardiaceae bacterium]|nr:aldehyde dehydrogenase family protein [Pseudonocardiaceae bacterium]